MPSYLVRMRETHEAVGIYSMEDVEELAYWVDEMMDPAECEYAEIRSGGVIWPRGRAKKFPVLDVNWERERRSPLNVIGRPELNESWFIEIIDEDLEFLPIVPDRDRIANDNEP